MLDDDGLVDEASLRRDLDASGLTVPGTRWTELGALGPADAAEGLLALRDERVSEGVPAGCERSESVAVAHDQSDRSGDTDGNGDRDCRLHGSRAGEREGCGQASGRVGVWGCAL